MLTPTPPRKKTVLIMLSYFQPPICWPKLTYIKLIYSSYFSFFKANCIFVYPMPKSTRLLHTDKQLPGIIFTAPVWGWELKLWGVLAWMLCFSWIVLICAEWMIMWYHVTWQKCMFNESLETQNYKYKSSWKLSFFSKIMNHILRTQGTKIIA